VLWFCPLGTIRSAATSPASKLGARLLIGLLAP
jgi:hypothetical protein